METVTAVKVCCGLALFVWFHRCASADDVLTYYMEESCGRTIKFSSVDTTEFVFNLTRVGSRFSANMYCPVVILANIGFKIMFKFTRLDFSSSTHYMALYSTAIDGRYGIDTFINDLSSTYISTTPSNKGILLFKSGTSYRNGGMSVLVTMFAKAKQIGFGESRCEDGHFFCLNERCISEDLVCNTRDNCGDESDEWADCSLLPWWSSVLIAFVVFFLISGICIICKLSQKQFICFQQPGHTVALGNRLQINTITNPMAVANNNLEMTSFPATQGSMQIQSQSMAQSHWVVSPAYNNQQNIHQVPPHVPMQMGVPYQTPPSTLSFPVYPPGLIPHSPTEAPPAYSSLAMNPSAPPLGPVSEVDDHFKGYGMGTLDQKGLPPM
ncbi:uncharacterized protein [Haliotis cracherodii]|uniref:uncharacterized protein n=1 Tax=Haliotis cracherodii TaxID=6455 RepID=UPI0039E8449E